VGLRRNPGSLTMQLQLDSLIKLWPILVPLILLELGLLIFALIDVIRRQRVSGNNKVLWILIIVLINLIGPIIYLAIGRKEDLVDSDKD
jgi:hypothetical protein